DPVPLVLLARSGSGQTVAYVSDALPAEALRPRAGRDHARAFPNVDSLLQTLRTFGFQPQVGHFKTYRFPPQYAHAENSHVHRYAREDPRIKAFGFEGCADEVFAVEVDGVIVSACVSARQNTRCAEAWVFTTPEHRRKGLARLTVTAWAR